MASNEGITAETEQLNLLDRAFFRLLSLDTDEKFEQLLDQLLCPIISQLPISNNVREKAIELLNHVSRRVKNNRNMKLPVVQLLRLYVKSSNAFIINFSMVYANLGFDRLNEEKQLECVGPILDCLEKHEGGSFKLDALYSFLVKSCRHIKNVKIVENNKTTWNIPNRRNKGKILTAFTDVLLYPNGRKPSFPTDTNSMNMIKLGILRLLSQCGFGTEEVASHFIIASCDCDDSISMEGEKLLRNFDNDFSRISDKRSLEPLYAILLENYPSNEGAISSHFKLRLLQQLTKLGAFCFPECLQLAIMCLRPDEETTRLQILASNHVLSAMNRLDKFDPSHEFFVKDLLSNICEYLWTCHCDLSVRPLLYQMIGKLMLLVQNLDPTFKTHSLTIFRKLLADLSQPEFIDMTNTIKETSMLIIPVFRETRDEILKIFLELMPESNSFVQIVAINYLYKLFPCDDVTTRFLLLILSTSWNSTVREEAQSYLVKGLTSSEPLKDWKMPNFATVTKYLGDNCTFSEENGTMVVSFAFNSINSDEKEIMMVDDTKLMMIQITTYMRLCMIYEHDPNICIKDLKHPCKETPALAAHIRNVHKVNATAIDKYFNLMDITLQTTGLNERILEFYYELVACAPEIFVKSCINRLPFLEKNFTNCVVGIRETVASLYGTLVAFSESAAGEHLAQLEARIGLEAVEMEKKHAILVACSKVLERQKRLNMGKAAILNTVKCLDEKSPLLISAACNLLGHVGRRLKPSEDTLEEFTVKIKKCKGERADKTNILATLLALALDGKSNHEVKKAAIQALGMIYLEEETLALRKGMIVNILEGPIKGENGVGACKDQHLMWDWGETMANCIAGRYSAKNMDDWTGRRNVADGEEGVCKQHAELFTFAFEELKKIMAGAVEAQKSGVPTCLLAIVKNCSNLPLNLTVLSQVQMTLFEAVLKKKEDCQDIAMKALSYIPQYAKSMEEVDILAKEVMDKLVLMNRSNYVDDKGTIHLFKRLSNMVLSLKNNKLFYVFLNLLTHSSSTQSTRRVFSDTFKEEEEKALAELRPYYGELVTPIFVQKFDPMPKIKDSMLILWNALFPESGKTVVEYCEVIFAKITADLFNSDSYARVANCIAAHTLLRIKGNELIMIVKKDVVKMLDGLYKLMDDIYPFVRVEAKTTTSAYLHACIQHRLRKGDDSLISELLPIIIGGMSSTVQEIRAVSVTIILEMCDKFGAALKNKYADFIPAMLENATDVDVSKLGKLGNQFVNDEDVSQKIDDIKEDCVSQHYSIKATKKCIEHMDSSVLKELMPKVLPLLKESFSTKLAAMNFMTLLVNGVPKEEIGPFSSMYTIVAEITGRMLRSLTNLLSTSQPSIWKNAAKTIAHVTKISKEEIFDKLISRLSDLYLNSEPEADVKIAVGYTLKAISNRDQERIQQKAEVLVPLLFFATHSDKNKNENAKTSGAKIWEELWGDVAPLTSAAVSKYKTGIMVFLKTAVRSSDWAVKAQAAKTLSTFAKNCQEYLKTDVECKDLCDNVLQSIGGKWTGKEHMLQALLDVCECNCLLPEDLHEKTIATTLKECRRPQRDYRLCAFKILELFLKYHNAPLYDEVFKIAEFWLKRSEDDAEVKLDSQSRIVIYGFLQDYFPSSKEEQSKYLLPVTKLIAFDFTTNDKNSRSAITCLKNLQQKCAPEDIDGLLVEISKIVDVIVEMKDESNLENMLCILNGIPVSGTEESAKIAALRLKFRQ